MYNVSKCIRSCFLNMRMNFFEMYTLRSERKVNSFFAFSANTKGGSYPI